MKRLKMQPIPVVNTSKIVWVITDNQIFKAMSKDVYKRESQSSEQFSRRLCNTGNFDING